jgi:hypothetical protein
MSERELKRAAVFSRVTEKAWTLVQGAEWMETGFHGAKDFMDQAAEWFFAKYACRKDRIPQHAGHDIHGRSRPMGGN